MLRVRTQAGIEHFADLGMSVEVASDGLAIGVVLKHANGESLDTPRNQKTIHGRQASTGRSLNEMNFLCVFGAREDHGTTGTVAVAVEVFGHRMDYDVRTEFDGALQIRSEKRVVDDQNGMALVRELGHRGYVGQTHGGVGRCFDVQHFGIRTQGPKHYRRVSRVDKAEFQTEMNKKLCRDAVNAAIDSLREQYVVAGTQKTENCVDARHAGRKSVRAVAAFELGESAFDRFAIGVVGARVIIAALGL